MKKNYFMLAAATMMLAACAETDLVNEIVVEETQQAIGFETFAQKVTRNSSVTTMNTYHTDFGVWTYKTPTGGSEATVMDNYKVAYGTGGWTYADIPSGQQVKFWDKLADYEFFAYAPYADNVEIDENDVIKIPVGEYAASENLQESLSTELNSKVFESDVDWMIADKATRTVETKDYSTVGLNFKHTMSKIIVKLKSTVANTEIISVSINNVYGTGFYAHPNWTVSGESKSISGCTGNMPTANTEYHTMEYLLIPSATAPSFSIKYKVNGDTYEVKDVEIDGIEKFENNTCYTLTAAIGLSPIAFSATATDFTQSEVKDVTID